MGAHPARTFGEEARKLERVRCSSLIDWPVYPRLAHTMRPSNDAQRGMTRVGAGGAKLWSGETLGLGRMVISRISGTDFRLAEGQSQRLSDWSARFGQGLAGA